MTQVAIFIGSASDDPVVHGCAEVLKKLGISYRYTVTSAHRTPERTEKLMKELRVQAVSKKVMLAAGLVIQSLDEKGFFAAALEDIGVDYGLSVADMEEGLRLVQTFDPPGVGARTIQEALLIQTRRRKDAPAGAEELLLNHYDDFIRGHWKRLEEHMGLSPEGLGRIRRFLKKLALQPAAPADERTEFVRADIEILCDETSFKKYVLLPDYVLKIFNEEVISL